MQDSASQGSSHSRAERRAQARDSYLSKPVVHQSLYVFALNRGSGSTALAEKWNLTLEQPSAQKDNRASRRKSFLTGVKAASMSS
jgi:hypothetical protein